MCFVAVWQNWNLNWDTDTKSCFYSDSELDPFQIQSRIWRKKFRSCSCKQIQILYITPVWQIWIIGNRFRRWDTMPPCPPLSILLQQRNFLPFNSHSLESKKVNPLILKHNRRSFFETTSEFKLFKKTNPIFWESIFGLSTVMINMLKCVKVHKNT